MNERIRPELQGSPPGGDDDPFRLGWRLKNITLPDGTETVEEVPLTEEDLLFPEEGDFVVDNPAHQLDLDYCHVNLRSLYLDDPTVVVLCDCRVDYGVEGVRPLGPDILVLFGVREWLRRGTFHLAEEGGRPILVIEICSPSTRGNDIGIKVDLYYRVGVQKYVIVDRGPEGDGPPQLRGRQRGRKNWRPLPLDEQGRLDLSPVPLWLGVEDDQVWLYDETGRRLPDPATLRKALAEAEENVQRETKAREKAERKARGAKAKVRQEAAARAEAEARARAEAEARAALEQRLRELEEQLRRRKNGT
jgi:colicin import membrane protein